MTLINSNQQWILDYAIPEAGITAEQFCRTAHIEKVADLSESRFDQALSWLEKKILLQQAKSQDY